MTSFTDLIAQGSAHAWLFIPSAILLGALHGLEPGHSKTMMAAFIIAIRGTVMQAVLLVRVVLPNIRNGVMAAFIIAIRGTLTQAVLLGLAATASHTAVVWLIALRGLYFGQQWGGEASEPYFQLASAVIIIGIAIWMAWRTWREQAAEKHDHHHHDEVQRVSTRGVLLALEVCEDGVRPRWRNCFLSARPSVS